MIALSVLSPNGTALAEASGEDEAMLCFDGIYEDGSVVLVRAEPGARLCFSPDAAVAESFVFTPSGAVTWRVPFGEHRLAYPPHAFEGTRHIARVRRMTREERRAARNLALNPADLRGETDFFPHVTANVETRGESCFAARNVVDGMRFNTFHGEWPFQSWGIGAREDAWCRLDFGRPVVVERMALTLRADFPHDAYWVSGHVVADTGEDIAFALERTGERQFVELSGMTVRALRLERLQKSDDPSAFPALTEWEVFGHELEE